MGSRSKTNLAYIAGFLDGDGSLMLQIKKRKDGRTKYRFMCTICFYQDSRHEKPFHFIREVLGIGYVSKRNDGMSELRVNGFAQVNHIIHELLPYIRFKKLQAEALYRASGILQESRKLTQSDLLKLIDCMFVIQTENYATRSKKTKEELKQVLGLTP